MLKEFFAIASLTVLVAQAPPTPGPIPTPSPLPSVTPAPSNSPSPSPKPTASPLPTPVPTVSPLPTPLPTPLVLAPDAPPQILAVQLSDPVIHGGEKVTGTVITSTNVAAVEIRMAGHTLRLPRTDAGVWEMSYQMPSVPFWFRRDYTAQVVAINAGGVEAQRPITISIR